MARGNKYLKKRALLPDAVYSNRLLARLINRMMRSGKKTDAQKQAYQALEILRQKGQDPIKTLEDAVQIIGPKIEVRPRRVGGASYQVPIEVRGERKISLAIRWIIEAARKRPNKDYHTFADKLAAELTDIQHYQGEAIKKRDLVRKMAEANRAFAHFRW